MISVAEALEHVLARATPRSAQRFALADAAGLVLAEDITSSIDSPPYDKALMDGYAVRMEDAREGAELNVIEQVTAGEIPQQRLSASNATRIMTGAPLPPGTEAIIPVEHTSPVDGGARVRIVQCRVKPGSNLLRRGESMREGERILERGRSIRAMEIGLLAEVGIAEVSAIPRPTMAILATGNELVPHQQTPGPGQIRNSNGPMLEAMAHRANARAMNLGIARDTAEDLKRLVDQGLEADVLVMSGGVSAGLMDLVPTVLQQAGVRETFHHVNLKPGKPLWFGEYARGDHQCLVFGLPGNPVSSLVCFELFVRPALVQLAGRAGDESPRTVRAMLTHHHRQHDNRPTYFPARVQRSQEPIAVTPLPWKGSADLRTLVDAQALIVFSCGPREYQPGDQVDAHLLG